MKNGGCQDFFSKRGGLFFTLPQTRFQKIPKRARAKRHRVPKNSERGKFGILKFLKNPLSPGLRR